MIHTEINVTLKLRIMATDLTATNNPELNMVVLFKITLLTSEILEAGIKYDSTTMQHLFILPEVEAL
jgi:hypothetical protein